MESTENFLSHVYSMEFATPCDKWTIANRPAEPHMNVTYISWGSFHYISNNIAFVTCNILYSRISVIEEEKRRA
jgi:hypothetical protein